MVVALSFFAYAFAIVLFFFFFYLSKTNNDLPRNYPLVGMSGILFVNFHRLYDVALDLLRKNNGTFLFKSVWFTKSDMLVTSDPKNIHYITSTNFSNYPKGSESKEIFDILGISLFNVDFEEWKFYRKVFHHYVKCSQFSWSLNNAIVENVNQKLIPVLEHVAAHDMAVDFVDVLKRHLLDVAWLISTGYKLNTLTIDFPENPFGKAIDDACQAMFYRNVFPPIIWKPQSWLGIGMEKKLHSAKKTTREMIEDCMSKKKKELENEEASDESYDALKCYFLRPLEANKVQYSEQLIRDNVLALVFATYDTSSTTLSWFFWLLSKNPEAEEKIRREIEKCFPGSQGRKWRVDNKDELSKLVYLHSAICEALRLYPPIPFQHRSAVKADVLPSGHQVFPKTRVVMSGYGVGRMVSVWGEDCLEFRPERWIDENGNFKYETSAKNFTFNSGPRICPGKDVAFMLMKAAAATIIYNFHIEVVETSPIIAKTSIIHEMKHGMRVTVHKL